MTENEVQRDYNIHLHPNENEELLTIHGSLDDAIAVVLKHYPEAVFSDLDEQYIFIHGKNRVCGYTMTFWGNPATRDADKLDTAGWIDCGPDVTDDMEGAAP